MARGRKGKYETSVKSRFDEIRRWCESGATDKEIIEMLGISTSTFYDYKDKHGEFSELLKSARKVPVREIKAALYRRATGFQYSDVQEIEENGVVVRRIRNTRTALPDPASAMILLKHWAKDEGWTNDPQALEVRKQELELKRKQIEEGTW